MTADSAGHLSLGWNDLPIETRCSKLCVRHKGDLTQVTEDELIEFHLTRAQIKAEAERYEAERRRIEEARDTLEVVEPDGTTQRFEFVAGEFHRIPKGIQAWKPTVRKPASCTFTHRGTTRAHAPRRRPTRQSSSARRASKEPHEPEPPLDGGCTEFQEAHQRLLSAFDTGRERLGRREWVEFIQFAATRVAHEHAQIWDWSG